MCAKGVCMSENSVCMCAKGVCMSENGVRM